MRTGEPISERPIVHFYGDGSADSAAIRLSDSGKYRVVRVDWLTGQVRLEN